MTDTTITQNLQSVDGTTPSGITNTITVGSGFNWGRVCGPLNQDDPTATPFSVDGTLVFNIQNNSSISLGDWGSSSPITTINHGGVVIVNGSGQQGSTDFLPTGFFNIAGQTTNNGSINISNITLYNYMNTNNITGTGTINLTNVTLATTSRNQYSYQNTTFTQVSGQTINMTNSQVSFGSSGNVGAINNVTINCSGGGNYIAVYPGIQVNDFKIRGFGNGDILDLCSTGQGDTCVYDPKTGLLTIYTKLSGNTVSQTIDIGLGYDPNGFSIVKTYTGSTDTGISYTKAPPCYLAGTLISTTRGLVRVEDITLLDSIITYENGQEIPRRVIWTGKSQVDASRSFVIVRQGALGNNIPFQDLHLTEEHCLFFKGSFVPVRMLVNGHSIIYNKSSDNYDVYHIELESHSIVWANGTLSESFLDTGHIAFDGRKSRNLTWEQDSAAPLCTARKFVEPIYREIAARVPGLVVSTDDHRAHSEANISLLVNGKMQVAPMRRNGQTFVFQINEPIFSLSILTDAASPSSVIGPFVDDRRMLGALVGEVNLFTPEGMTTYGSHLSESALTGWHDLESSQYRWTGAQAEFPDVQSESEKNVLAVAVYA